MEGIEMNMTTTRMRLERLADERGRNTEKIEDILKIAEEESRDLGEFETTQLSKYREKAQELDDEINILASDLERAEKSRDVSQLIRVSEPAQVQTAGGENGPTVYRTFAQYARDELINRYPLIAAHAGGDQVKQAAIERLSRVDHTLTSDVGGLLPPQHMAQIMDIIDKSRPVIATARQVNLSSGKMTYPKIAQRPEVLYQGTVEKTEGGTLNMQVTLEDITADTYIGGGNLSWQTINWSTPDALQLWFDLAAEAYARATETAACADIEAAGGGTISTALGTAGTEDFGAWRAAVLAAVATVYTNTAGRAQPDTLYLAPDRFFQVAGLSSQNVVQLSAVGQVDVGSLTGTFNGLRVVGSYGFQPSTAILGDRSAFLVGETAGAPVELRAVEPAIGGMEVGVIGAFKSKVFDADRFIHLS